MSTTDGAIDKILLWFRSDLSLSTTEKFKWKGQNV